MSIIQELSEVVTHQDNTIRNLRGVFLGICIQSIYWAMLMWIYKRSFIEDAPIYIYLLFSIGIGLTVYMIQLGMVMIGLVIANMRHKAKTILLPINFSTYFASIIVGALFSFSQLGMMDSIIYNEYFDPFRSLFLFAGILFLIVGIVVVFETKPNVTSLGKQSANGPIDTTD